MALGKSPGARFFKCSVTTVGARFSKGFDFQDLLNIWPVTHCSATPSMLATGYTLLKMLSPVSITKSTGASTGGVAPLQDSPRNVSVDKSLNSEVWFIPLLT